MERCAFGTRTPESLLTLPERVLAIICAKMGDGARNIRKKAMGARTRTTLCPNNSKCQRHALRMYFRFRLFPAPEPRRSPEDLGPMPNMIIPISPTLRSRQSGRRLLSTSWPSRLWNDVVNQYLCLFDGCFLRLRNRRNQNDELRDRRVKTPEFRNQQRGFRNRPRGSPPQSFVVVRVDLFEHFHKAGCPCVVDAFAWHIKNELVNPALGVDRIDHFPAVRVHHHQFPGFINVRSFYPAADKQPVVGRIQVHGMRLRPPGDRPRSDHLAFFAINDHHLAGVAHYYKHSWRPRIQHQPSGIQPLDLYASREFAVL